MYCNLYSWLYTFHHFFTVWPRIDHSGCCRGRRNGCCRLDSLHIGCRLFCHACRAKARQPEHRKCRSQASWNGRCDGSAHICHVDQGTDWCRTCQNQKSSQIRVLDDSQRTITWLSLKYISYMRVGELGYACAWKWRDWRVETLTSRWVNGPHCLKPFLL